MKTKSKVIWAIIGACLLVFIVSRPVEASNWFASAGNEVSGWFQSFVTFMSSL